MAVDQNMIIERPRSRFDWVMSGKDRGPLPVFDEPLLASSDGVVIPSVGSMVPGWTLLIPRHPSPNFASLGTRRRKALADLRREVLARLHAAFVEPIYEFEHGPAISGGALGCGADQAHLHIVPLPFNLVDAIRTIPGKLFEFDETAPDPWCRVPNATDYILVRNASTGRGAIVLPEVAQSQIVRRIIASRIGRMNEWDYKLAIGARQAAQTQRAFASNTE